MDLRKVGCQDRRWRSWLRSVSSGRILYWQYWNCVLLSQLYSIIWLL